MSNETSSVQRRASSAVYDTIREMAIEFRFRPDEKINESELAGRLGVSRTPVREALNRLLIEGLLHFEKNRGYYCRSLTAADLFFLAESRRTIEVGMLDQVIARATDAKLDDLSVYAANLVRDLAILPPCELARADEAFHFRLAAMSCNPVTVELLRNVNARVRFMRKIRIEDAKVRATVFNEHVNIVAAVKARDLPLARRLLDAHLAFSEDDAAAVLKEGLGKIYLNKIHMDVDLMP
ncbi:MAG: GntR family transcriptional regulator [Sphingomonadales bacterium]|nr:GntR family transcriptional regulator [Sphingomonadales bacterium]